MKLAEKGRFAPPPTLEGPAQSVAEEVASWRRVRARTHWLLGDERAVDGADFYVGEDELGHIHLDGEAHVFHTRLVADALLAAGLGQPFRWSRNIVVFSIEREADVAHALWLFRLNYDHCLGTPTKELLARVASHRRSSADRKASARA